MVVASETPEDVVILHVLLFAQSKEFCYWIEQTTLPSQRLLLCARRCKLPHLWCSTRPAQEGVGETIREQSQLATQLAIPIAARPLLLEHCQAEGICRQENAVQRPGWTQEEDPSCVEELLRHGGHAKGDSAVPPVAQGCDRERWRSHQAYLWMNDFDIFI